nr:olfactory receptor 31 [Tropidothorax elegans]
MRIPEETMELNFFRTFLKITGFWYFRREGSGWLLWMQYIRLLAFVGTVILWDYMLALQKPSELQSKAYTPVVVWGNIYLISMIVYCRNAGNVEEWTERMSSLLRKHHEPWKIRRFSHLTKLTWKYLVLITCIQTVLGCVVTSCVSLLVDFFMYMTVDSQEPFYLEMALEDLLGERKRSLKFYSLELFNGLLLAIPILYYGGLIGLSAGSAVYVGFELEMISDMLRKWTTDQSSEQQKKMLKMIVDDHSEVIRLIKLIENTIAQCFLSHNATASVIAGNFLFLAKKALEERNLGLMASQIYLSVVTIFNSYVACFIGEYFRKQVRQDPS